MVKALGGPARLRTFGALADRPQLVWISWSCWGLERGKGGTGSMLDGRELGALARPATGASEMHDASGALHTSSPAVMDQEEREQAKVIRDYFEGKWIKKITACSLSLNREPHREPLADGVAGRSCCGFPGHESAGVRSAVCSCLQATVTVSRHQSSVTPSRARDLSLSAQVSAICRQDGRLGWGNHEPSADC